MGILLIAGCAAPAAPRDDAGGDASALPSSFGVDLHTSQVNISMPAGNSTAVVVLNVTKDMWVAAPMDFQPAQNPQWWGVCVVVQAHGLLETGIIGVVAMRLDEGRLVPFAPRSNEFKPREYGNSTSPGCYKGANIEERTDPRLGLNAMEPFDVELVILLGAVSGTASPDTKALAPFHIAIGIGTKPCPQTAFNPQGTLPFQTWCAPSDLVEAVPLQRGHVGRAHFSTDGTVCELSGPFVGGCTGFEVDDRRNQVGPFSSGTIRLVRNASAGGLVFGYIFVTSSSGPGVQGINDVRVSAKFEDAPAAVECRGIESTSVGLMGWSDTDAALAAETTAQGDIRVRAYSWEFGLDAPALGWTVPTSVWTLSTVAAGPVPEDVGCLP